MNRYLVDTHLLLWATSNSPRLSSMAREILEDFKNTLFFSPISLWEIGVKRALNRPDFTYETAAVRDTLLDRGFLELAFTGLKALRIADLPPIHRDPYDRILLAQALAANLTLITADKLVASYPGNITLV